MSKIVRYFVISESNKKPYEIGMNSIGGINPVVEPVVVDNNWQCDIYRFNATNIKISVKHKKFIELEINFLGIEHSVKWDENDESFFITFDTLSEVTLKVGLNNNEEDLWIRFCN